MEETEIGRKVVTEEDDFLAEGTEDTEDLVHQNGWTNMDHKHEQKDV